MATGPVKRADRCVSDDLEHHIPLFIRIEGDDQVRNRRMFITDFAEPQPPLM
jgi:hypothetical protein